MAKTKLTYTEKGKNSQTMMFRCMGDAKEHLTKLEANLEIIKAEVVEIGKKESALHYLGRSMDK